MKKGILLLTAILMTAISVNAADWAKLDNGISNVQVSLDKDSIHFVDDNTCLYAMKIKKGNENEKVVFIKSDYLNNKLGIIRTVDFDESTYNPKSVYVNAPAFMKPVDSDSLFAYGHRFTESIYDEKIASSPSTNNLVAKSENNNFKFIPVSFIYSFAKPQTFDEYVNYISNELYRNWNPPKSGRNTQTIVITNIGKDGALMGYDVAKSSGDEMTDRSVISAILKSAPFIKAPNKMKNKDNINIQFVFEYNKFIKSVK